MIVVKIELWPFGMKSAAQEIGRMHIANDGTMLGEDDSRSNYNVRVMKRGTERTVVREGRVEDFPRKSYSVWRLVMRALASAFPEEKSAAK